MSTVPLNADAIWRNPKEFIHGRSNERPTAIALICGSTILSYIELRDQIDALAVTLRQLGVARGGTAVLFLENSCEFVLSFYALLRIGAVACPISLKSKDDEIASFLSDVHVTCVIHRKDGSRRFPMQAGNARFAIDVELEGGQPKVSSAPLTPPVSEAGEEPNEMAPVVHLHSTGSTGRPKHIFKNAKQLYFTAWHFCETFEWNAEDIFVAAVPFSHQYGLITLLSAHAVGGTLLIIPQFHPRETLEAIDGYQATAFLATPPMLALLGQCRLQRAVNLASLKHIVVSTAPLRQEDYLHFAKRFTTPVFDVYGATEATGCTVCRVTADLQPGCVGTVMKGVEIGVFDNERTCRVRSGIGLVGIRSPSSPPGYMNDLEATVRVFKDGFVFPGDVGYFDEQHRLFIVGRDNVINVGGMKVDAVEVELVLVKHEMVRECAVYGLNDLVCALIVPSTESTIVDLDALVRYCSARLANHKVPKKIKIVPVLPRDEFGKIMRRQLAQA
jgi:long-chain acyl-CoA synthetase